MQEHFYETVINLTFKYALHRTVSQTGVKLERGSFAAFNINYLYWHL